MWASRSLWKWKDKMRKSRPRGVFLNIFIIRDPFRGFTAIRAPVDKPWLSVLHLLSRNSSPPSFIKVAREHPFLLSTTWATTEFIVRDCGIYSGRLPRKGKAQFSPDSVKFCKDFMFKGPRDPDGVACERHCGSWWGQDQVQGPDVQAGPPANQTTGQGRPVHT